MVVLNPSTGSFPTNLNFQLIIVLLYVVFYWAYPSSMPIDVNTRPFPPEVLPLVEVEDEEEDEEPLPVPVPVPVVL